MGNLCSQVQTRDPEVYHQVYLIAGYHPLPSINMLLSDVHTRFSQSGWEPPAGVVTLEPARSGFGDSSPTRRHSNVRPTRSSTLRLWPRQHNLTHHILQASGRPRTSQQLGDLTARQQEAALAPTSPQRVKSRQKASSGSGGRSGSGALPGLL